MYSHFVSLKSSNSVISGYALTKTGHHQPPFRLRTDLCLVIIFCG